MRLTQRQEYELIASIAGRGEIPLKFVYLDKGAEKWDRLSSSWARRKGTTTIEAGLLQKRVRDFISSFDVVEGVNVVDLGPGSGQPIDPILDELERQDIAFTYTMVDISDAMLEIAATHMKQTRPELQAASLHLDFEKESLVDHMLGLKENRFANLLVILGNTIGNFGSIESVLKNFLDSLTTEDYLLVGNGLANQQNADKLVAMYSVAELEDCVTYPAIELGLYRQDDVYEVIWNEKLKQIEAQITLRSDRTIELADRKVVLSRGDQFKLMKSRKYDEATLTSLLSAVGFRTELFTTTQDRSYMLTLVQPSRYSV